jgi:hypothetical protein
MVHAPFKSGERLKLHEKKVGPDLLRNIGTGQPLIPQHFNLSEDQV